MYADDVKLCYSYTNIESAFWGSLQSYELKLSYMQSFCLQNMFLDRICSANDFGILRDTKLKFDYHVTSTVNKTCNKLFVCAASSVDLCIRPT